MISAIPAGGTNLAHNAAQPTSGETYFFRDHGQFDLLRLRLLPELIARNRERRTLRLWSAGCSSGEEAYSLAILLDMLLPAPSGWNIVIIGSDINKQALQKARQAQYGQWSFRMFPKELQQRYFRHSGDEWALDERIRRLVTFVAVDLVGDPIPGVDLYDMDLVLCRNVFIYFNPDTVMAVAAKLAATLGVGGYLVTGHTELIGHSVRELKARLFAEGVVYQRISTPPAAQRTMSQPVCAAIPASATGAPTGEVLLAEARTLADRGEYALAEQACTKALAADPLAAQPCFLLAQLAQIKGDFECAKELLNKTLYLDSRFVATYLELAALYERAGDVARTRALREGALNIVRTLPGDTVIEPYEATARDLLQWLAQLEHAL